MFSCRAFNTTVSESDMKKIQKAAKLSLNKESVRNLSQANLAAAAGGIRTRTCQDSETNCTNCWGKGAAC
jgi:hypothetical protein